MGYSTRGSVRFIPGHVHRGVTHTLSYPLSPPTHSRTTHRTRLVQEKHCRLSRQRCNNIIVFFIFLALNVVHTVHLLSWYLQLFSVHSIPVVLDSHQLRWDWTRGMAIQQMKSKRKFWKMYPVKFYKTLLWNWEPRASNLLKSLEEALMSLW